MVSEGSHEEYHFEEYSQLTIDSILEDMTDRVTALSFIGDIVRWFLTEAGRWKPIPIDHIDWEWYVMPRRFYDSEGFPKFTEADTR